MRRASSTSSISGSWLLNSVGVLLRPALYSAYSASRKVWRETSKATREVGGLLVAQHVDEHRGEAEDGVGVLAGAGREVLHREREERPVGQRVPVEQEQAGADGGVGRGGGVRHVATLATTTDRPERPPAADAVVGAVPARCWWRPAGTAGTGPGRRIERRAARIWPSWRPAGARPGPRTRRTLDCTVASGAGRSVASRAQAEAGHEPVGVARAGARRRWRRGPRPAPRRRRRRPPCSIRPTPRLRASPGDTVGESTSTHGSGFIGFSVDSLSSTAPARLAVVLGDHQALLGRLVRGLDEHLDVGDLLAAVGAAARLLPQVHEEGCVGDDCCTHAHVGSAHPCHRPVAATVGEPRPYARSGVVRQGPRTPHRPRRRITVR